MFNPYDFLKSEAVNLLRSSVCENADSGDIHACASGFELSTPLPLIVKANADLWVNKIPCSPYFKEIKALNGHICFALSNTAYAYCTKRIIAENALNKKKDILPQLNSIKTDEYYAYMRMRMLAEKNSDDAVFLDESVKAALWASFALVLPCSQSALKNACTKALAIGQSLSPKERFLLKEHCGDVGLCTALLIYRRLDLK